MVKGTVEIMRPGQTEWKPLAVKDGVLAGSKLRAGADGEADILVTAKGAIRLKPGTEITIEENNQTGENVRIHVKVDAGRLLHRFDKLGANTEYKVTTPTAGAVIRGTEFDVTAAPDQTRVRVLAGNVAVTGASGDVTVGEKQGTTIATNAAPTAPSQLSQKDVDAVLECSLVNFVVALQKARRVASLAEMRNISTPLEVWAAQHDGLYPQSLAEAGVGNILDNWKQSYEYERIDDGKGFVIVSSGPDRVMGTDDDLEYRR